jgi:tetratricopeptide (TPR) repeat protein
VAWFLNKLLTLHGIVLAWDTPIVRDQLLEWLAALGIFTIITGYALLSKRMTNRLKFGLAWFLIGLIPVGLACFSRPFLGFVIQPHWLFLSAIGFCVMLAEVLLHLRRPLSIGFLTILLITYGLTTRHYNELWSSEESYGLYWISVSEKNFWPNFWIGHYYLKNNDLERAKYYYNQILGLKFMQNEVRGNLGIIALRQGQLETAGRHFETLLASSYVNAETHTYLGDIYMRQKDFKKSEYHLKAAIHFDSYLRTPKELYIKLLEQNGRNAEAEAIRLELKQLSNPL